MTFLVFKIKAEVELGFKCYEDTRNNQLMFYGTSDKFDDFKNLAAGVSLPTGTMAYLMDTGDAKTYSAFKKSSVAVDVALKEYARKGQTPGDNILKIDDDIIAGDYIKLNSTEKDDPRDPSPITGIWVVSAYSESGETLKTDMHTLGTPSGSTKTTIETTINNKKVSYYKIMGSTSAGVTLFIGTFRPTFPGTWY